MPKTMIVDTQRSLIYAANGRVVPAQERETASYKDKIFSCHSCGWEVKVKKAQFGERRRCDQCGILMMDETIVS
jgi:predicted RNA-binding Zn-ribbon protein involved in translation (DUF1610 family)